MPIPCNIENLILVINRLSTRITVLSPHSMLKMMFYPQLF